MLESDDISLLQQYASSNSESAFTALVERHVNLVYSVALRSVGHAHAAEEIAQAVFIILAKKARNLSKRTVLSGWLYQTTRLTAANYLRTEIRRQKREQEAYMQSLLNEPGPEVWRQIAPLLDDAMGRMGERDRNAIVLRFLENKNLREVGTALGTSEDAAKMRVNRALEKLRKYFGKRGISSTTAFIAGAVSANSVQAAPSSLAATIAAAKGSTVSATLITLVEGTMKTMTWLKLKLAAGVGVAVLLAVGVATMAISQTSYEDKLTPQEIAGQAQDAYAALSSYSDNGTAVTEGGGQTATTTFNIRLQRPNLYRIDWTQTGGSYTSKGVVWSAGNGDYFMMGAAGQEKTFKPQKVNDLQQALAMGTGVSGQASSTIPGTFFKQNWGDALGIFVSGRSQLKREGDEKVGDVDCHVISSVIDPAKLPGQGKLPNTTGKVGTITTTLWIGKRDHLIHQTRTTMESATITPPPESDSDIKIILERQNRPATPEAIAALRTELEHSLKLAQGAKYIFIQTHENIAVNRRFTPADFAR
jgi:RNA polymerase sigma factor (sigma-70 family)